MSRQAYYVRPYEPRDHDVAVQMMKDSFPFFQRFSLVFEEGVFILENSEKILGMIKGKTFTLDNRRKIGVIAWLMIEPESQSKAYAGPLMKNLMNYFEHSACDEVLACAHHINTPSSAGMSFFGFVPLSLNEQLTAYGLDLFKVWKKSYHIFDYAHLLWRKTLREEPSAKKADSLVLHLGLNAVVVTVVALLTGVPFYSLALFGIIYLLLRHGVFYTVLKSSGFQKLRFQGWESGYLLSTLVSGLSGLWLPCPGMLVKGEDKWRIHQIAKPMFLAATLFSILGLGSAWLLGLWGQQSGVFILKTLWLELSLIFFPFDALLGAWIYRKHKVLWGLIWTITTLALGMIIF